MEHIKWIFDGFGVVLSVALLGFLTRYWKQQEKRKNLILVIIFSLLLVAVVISQYYLFENYWLAFIQLNRMEIVIIIFISILISLLISFIYQKNKFLEIRNEYKSIELKLEKNNSELQEELRLVKASDNFIDNVTGLPNSKAIEHILLESVNRCKDKNVPMSLIMVDIEGFKNINKIYSVQGADLLLKLVGQYLQKSIRTEDKILRFRVGDEFLIIAYDTNINGALGFKNRIKRQIVRENFLVDNNQIKIAASIGVVEYDFNKPFIEYESQTNNAWKELEVDKSEEEKN